MGTRLRLPHVRHRRRLTHIWTQRVGEIGAGRNKKSLEDASKLRRVCSEHSSMRNNHRRGRRKAARAIAEPMTFVIIGRRVQMVWKWPRNARDARIARQGCRHLIVACARDSQRKEPRCWLPFRRGLSVGRDDEMKQLVALGVECARAHAHQLLRTGLSRVRPNHSCRVESLGGR